MVILNGHSPKLSFLWTLPCFLTGENVSLFLSRDVLYHLQIQSDTRGRCVHADQFDMNLQSIQFFRIDCFGIGNSSCDSICKLFWGDCQMKQILSFCQFWIQIFISKQLYSILYKISTQTRTYVRMNFRRDFLHFCKISWRYFYFLHS